MILLALNAGMVQFKNWFTGEEKPKYQNVVTYQKCIGAEANITILIM